MRQFLGMWNSKSIVVKLMGAFVLVILPLYVISTLMTVSSSAQMQAEVESAHESKLHFYHSHLEFELQRMNGLVNEYTFDETMSTLSTRIPIMSTYEVTSSLNNIHNKLTQIRETSPYISDVVYYVPALHKRVSAVDGIRTVDDEEWKRLIDSMGNLHGALSHTGNDLYLLRSNPYNMNRDEAPNFLLGIRLSSEELKRRLQEFSETGGSEITLAFGSQNDIVISSSGQPAAIQQAALTLDASQPAEYITRYDTQGSYHYSLYDREHYFTLTASIPHHVLNAPIEKYTLWVWILTIISIFIIFIYSFSVYKSIHKPMSVLIGGFKTAEQGQTGIHIPHSRRDEFGYLYSRFNDMLKRLHTLIEDNYVARIRTSEAELKHLQSQIKPHFLYNSFFNIKQMAEVENVELIQQFTDYLGQYFRYMTRDSKSEVSLGEEIDHALVYLAIQNIRFGSRVHATVPEIEPNFRGITVPRVIIQPVIENAFEHSLSKRIQGGILKISYESSEGKLRILIEDNGQELTEDALNALSTKLSYADHRYEGEEITGLMNVHQRLRIKFGNDFGLSVVRSELGGLCVIFSIPLQGEDE
ncbi:histidine kinase [Neobacillus mesonae]|nr:histidine kinase [Neobacillus mesonae]